MIKTCNTNAIVFITNEEYAPGFFASLASTLSFGNLEHFNIYIFYPENSPNDALNAAMEIACDRAKFPRERCKLIGFNSGKYKHANPLPNGSHLSYVKYELAAQLDERNILYLDSDVLVLDDVSKLIELMPEDTPLAAVQDQFICTHTKDPYLLDGRKPDPGASYFNSGVMLLNGPLCREMNLLEEVERLLPRLSRLKFADQTPFNILFKNVWAPLPKRWNVLTTPIRPASLFKKELAAGIIHFVTQNKPWKHATLDAPNILWHILDQHFKNEVDQINLNELFAPLVDAYQSTTRWPLKLKAFLYQWIPHKRSRAGRLKIFLDLPNQLSQLNTWLATTELGSIPDSCKIMIEKFTRMNT